MQKAAAVSHIAIPAFVGTLLAHLLYIHFENSIRLPHEPSYTGGIHSAGRVAQNCGRKITAADFVLLMINYVAI